MHETHSFIDIDRPQIPGHHLHYSPSDFLCTLCLIFFFVCTNKSTLCWLSPSLLLSPYLSGSWLSRCMATHQHGSTRVLADVVVAKGTHNFLFTNNLIAGLLNGVDLLDILLVSILHTYLTHRKSRERFSQFPDYPTIRYIYTVIFKCYITVEYCVHFNTSHNVV